MATVIKRKLTRARSTKRELAMPVTLGHPRRLGIGVFKREHKPIIASVITLVTETISEILVLKV